MSILNDLFNKILESEEHIRQRFDKLKRVNLDIIEYQGKIKEARFEEKSLRGTISVKTQKLVEVDVERTELCLQENILEEQIIELNKKNKELEEQIADIETKVEEDRAGFLQETEDFISKYDLSMDLGAEHEGVCIQEFEKLDKEKRDLLEEIERLKYKLVSIAKDKEKLKDLSESVKKKEALRNDLSKDLKSLKDCSAELGMKRHMLLRSPNNDYEFKRLRQELDDLRKKVTQLNEKRQELAGGLP